MQRHLLIGKEKELRRSKKKKEFNSKAQSVSLLKRTITHCEGKKKKEELTLRRRKARQKLALREMCSSGGEKTQVFQNKKRPSHEKKISHPVKSSLCNTSGSKKRKSSEEKKRAGGGGEVSL